MSVAAGENRIKVPKCKPIKAKVHREITGKIKSITLTRTPTGKYYASVLAEDGKTETKPVTDIQESGVIGVDVGLTDIAITSNGVKTGNPRFIKNAQRNLKRKQKKLSRSKKGSIGRAKVRLLVAKAHERVAFARNDFQHKLTKQLVDETQAAICVETLKVKNMLKNHCLARSIADADWHSLITKLDYKTKQAGKHLVNNHMGDVMTINTEYDASWDEGNHALFDSFQRLRLLLKVIPFRFRAFKWKMICGA